jgi:hypothetical protein
MPTSTRTMRVLYKSNSAPPEEESSSPSQKTVTRVSRSVDTYSTEGSTSTAIPDQQVAVKAGLEGLEPDRLGINAASNSTEPRPSTSPSHLWRIVNTLSRKTKLKEQVSPPSDVQQDRMIISTNGQVSTRKRKRCRHRQRNLRSVDPARQNVWLATLLVAIRDVQVHDAKDLETFAATLEAMDTKLNVVAKEIVAETTRANDVLMATASNLSTAQGKTNTVVTTKDNALAVETIKNKTVTFETTKDKAATFKNNKDISIPVDLNKNKAIPNGVRQERGLFRLRELCGSHKEKYSKESECDDTYEEHTFNTLDDEYTFTEDDTLLDAETAVDDDIVSVASVDVLFNWLTCNDQNMYEQKVANGMSVTDGSPRFVKPTSEQHVTTFADEKDWDNSPRNSSASPAHQHIDWDDRKAPIRAGQNTLGVSRRPKPALCSM